MYFFYNKITKIQQLINSKTAIINLKVIALPKTIIQILLFNYLSWFLKASYRTYWFRLRELVNCDLLQKRLRLNTEIGICDYSAKFTIVITLIVAYLSQIITSFLCFFVKRLKSKRFSSIYFKISLETKFSHDPKAVKNYRNMRIISKIIVIDLCAVIILIFFKMFILIFKFYMQCLYTAFSLV